MARQPTTSIDTKKIPEAIKMLDSGSTKKDVCAFLGMSYNTSRLASLIEDYLSGVERSKEQRRLRRGKAILDTELVNIIESYMSGDSIANIADRFYRSEALVKSTLEKHGALLRDSKANPLSPSILPDNAMSDSFEEGDIVWLAAYSMIGEIKKKISPDGYRVYILNRDYHRYVNQYAHDLGSMKYLESLGVDVKRFGSIMPRDEVIALLNEAVRGANKNNDK